MDRATIDVYDARAEQWLAARRPASLESAGALGRRAVDAAGPDRRAVIADLGCGPGWHLAALGASGALVVGMDASAGMLHQAEPQATRSRAPLVQGDLEALPFGRVALDGAWARHSYVHLRRGALPEALADLHRVLRVGAPVTLSLFGGGAAGPADGAHFAGDDFPGRRFSTWSEAQLEDVVVGAGFELEQLTARVAADGAEVLTVRAVRARTLPDRVAPGLQLLLCGLNPSVYAADAGVGFARPGNRFWPAAVAAGIVTRPRDPTDALWAHGVGMTDLVKRATPGAAVLAATEYDAGLQRVERLVQWLQPGAVCVLGLAGWRAVRDRKAVAGAQPAGLGGRPVYLMPNPSGLNAHATVATLAGDLRAAMALADRNRHS